MGTRIKVLHFLHAIWGCFFVISHLLIETPSNCSSFRTESSIVELHVDLVWSQTRVPSRQVQTLSYTPHRHSGIPAVHGRTTPRLRAQEGAESGSCRDPNLEACVVSRLRVRVLSRELDTLSLTARLLWNPPATLSRDTPRLRVQAGAFSWGWINRSPFSDWKYHPSYCHRRSCFCLNKGVRRRFSESRLLSLW